MVTTKREKLLTRMNGVLDGSDWVRVPSRSFTIRWTREQPFPDHMRTYPGIHGGFPYKDYGPTYKQYVFLTMTSVGAMPILRTSHAPWTGARDRTITLTRALEILDDPASALEHPSGN